MCRHAIARGRRAPRSTPSISRQGPSPVASPRRRGLRAPGAPPAEVLAHARAGGLLGVISARRGWSAPRRPGCAPPLQERPVYCSTRGPAPRAGSGGRGNMKRPAHVLTLWIISRARGVGSVARQSYPRGPWHTGRRAGDRLCRSDGVCGDHPGARGRWLAHLGARRRSDRRSAAQWGLQGLWDRARAAWPQLGRQGRR